MKVSQISLGIKAALVSFAVAAGVVAVPVSQANVWFNTTGGASCKGSSGFGAQYFYFSNTSVQNTTNVAQYVTCELPYANNGAATTPVQIYVIGNNPTAGNVHYTCAVQSGYEGQTINTAIYEVDVPANNYGYIVDASAGSVPVIPAAPGVGYGPYSVSCRVPVNAKVGLIHVAVSGTL